MIRDLSDFRPSIVLSVIIHRCVSSLIFSNPPLRSAICIFLIQLATRASYMRCFLRTSAMLLFSYRTITHHHPCHHLMK